MRIGIPKEIKSHEYRVAATPRCVAAYVGDGHVVHVEQGAGMGAGYADADYAAAGARLEGDAEAVWQADMVVKVKEPLPEEFAYLRPGLVLFGYLHLAAAKPLTEVLIKRSVSAVAYETITDGLGQLPCLLPMSAIAGRLSIQAGARSLERPAGGRGVLLGGVPGVAKGKVLILGGGTVGTQAATMALGLGAQVTVIDRSQMRLYELDQQFGGRLQTLHSSDDTVSDCLKTADLTVGAVLIPGAMAPKLIRREHLETMQEGSVLVDVAVDQGGCAQTTRATTHDEPTYVVDGVIHYCVANMPAAVARTSTAALTAVTLPYGRKLAALGVDRAVSADEGLRGGLNTHLNRIVHPAVADAFPDLSLQSA